MGQSPADLLIGIGDAEQVERLEVRWPTGETQFFEGIPADSRVTITESSPEPVIESL